MKEKNSFKFRAWDKKDEVMTDWVWLSSEGDLYETPVTVYDTSHLELERNDDLILMQGWKPECQPELTIYKGDIINVHWFYTNHDPETLGVYEDETNLECVEIIEVRGVLGFYFEDDFLPLAFVPTHEESFEIIGNTYENPELLEEI